MLKTVNSLVDNSSFDDLLSTNLYHRGFAKLNNSNLLSRGVFIIQMHQIIQGLAAPLLHTRCNSTNDPFRSVSAQPAMGMYKQPKSP